MKRVPCGHDAPHPYRYLVCTSCGAVILTGVSGHVVRSVNEVETRRHSQCKGIIAGVTCYGGDSIELGAIKL